MACEFRKRILLIFIAIQIFVVALAVSGFFVKAISHNPSDKDEKVIWNNYFILLNPFKIGLLTLKIELLVETCVRLLYLVIFVYNSSSEDRVKFDRVIGGEFSSSYDN